LNDGVERVRTKCGSHEHFNLRLEFSRRCDRQFRKIFLNAGLPEDLTYPPHVESLFQPTAVSIAIGLITSILLLPSSARPAI
jgi:peptidoglycan lytic transglycosylase D